MKFTNGASKVIGHTTHYMKEGVAPCFERGNSTLAFDRFFAGLMRPSIIVKDESRSAGPWPAEV